MTPPPPERAGHILTAALDHAPEDREAFLATACGNDAALLAEVRMLLAAHEAMPTGFLAGSAVEGLAAGDLAVTIKHGPGTGAPLSATVEHPGETIGYYKLREQIGEGGFGTVWVADQDKPVRRRVALKIIKLGMDTQEVIARFEQERQALAMMDHPNIAKVLDAGATQTGRPFFVMELVRGVKITDYCDDKKLSTQERLELFITVCQAVQHAHQKGIIHRDLKPSNILVTVNDGRAVPKVIDFGVAKATQGRLSANTVYTQFQQMVGTPLYMSPEQAELTSLDIDTRSDIYALGVLLYELLTGGTPIDTATMAKAGMDEIRRLIREVDPPRPSMRMKTLAGDELTSMAKRRHTDAAKLPGALRGDLDWIVMKCLEKDRGRRYDTANGLAIDLQRHLQNEPVVARPPTTAYLLSKLFRRNRLAFAAGAAIAASLVIGIAASVWQAVRAEREAKRAVAALDELRATAPAFAEQARALAAKEQFAEAIEKLDYAIKLRPDAAEFLVQKGDLLQCQLQLAKAAAVYRAALTLQPGHTRAKTNAALCDELLAAKTDASGQLSHQSLAKLHEAMQQEQRPAAELMTVSRLLGRESEVLLAYWLEKLKDLPIPAEKPLKDRLKLRGDGLFALDLGNTKISSLTPLAGMRLGELVLQGCTGISDFSPLSEFRSLTSLNLALTRIPDLAPLRALPLTSLLLEGCAISDLSPLRGMKLKTIDLWFTQVSDLSPLAGMPITEFYASRLSTSDFSVLKGAPIETFALGESLVQNLSFLEGSGVKTLFLSGCDALRDLSILPRLRALERLILPRHFRELPDAELAAIAALREHPTLKWIQVDPGDVERGWWMMFTATLPKEAFWRDWDREQTFVPAIRNAGFKFSLSKLPDSTYRLSIDKQPLSDLSMLKGAPISELSVGGTQVANLAPIAHLPLRVLYVWGTPLADLSPLRGTKIEELSIEGTKVSDLSALKGLPLNKLYAHDCKNLADVSPLAEMPTLVKLTVPITAQGIEKLEALPNLKWLAFRPDGYKSNQIPTSAETFWKRWPGMAWSRALNETGMSYSSKQDADGNWSVTVTTKEFHDCSIFKGAPISELILRNTSVSDLRPLEGLALTKLDLRETPVSDLSPLRAKVLGGSLRDISLWVTRVTDFSPLTACTNLEVLNASGTPLADLSILRGRNLRYLHIASTPVSDISVLAGMPLTFLTLSGTAVTDLSPLLQCPKLETLTLPDGGRNVNALRDLPALTRLSFQYKDEGSTQKAVEFWKEYDEKSWRTALREAGIKPKSMKQLEDGTWDVNLENTKLSDLSVLAGAPISKLNVGGTAITDLTPLRGLPLTSLIFYGTRVRDLSPLHGMALENLHFSGTPVADLTPLRGMPLKSLGLGGTPVADLSALRGMALVEIKLRNSAVTDLSPLADSKTIEVISLPANAPDIEFLRDFPKILRISFNEEPKTYAPDKTRDEFWKEYDERRVLAALPGDPSKRKKLANGTWELDFGYTNISDLTLLKELSVSSLKLGHTAVSNLGPLKGKALTKLGLNDTKVADLSALKGMPIEDLNLQNTKEVTELSALRGMPLTRLVLRGCSQVTDLSPLADCKTLKTLILPANAKDIEFLQEFQLERIGYNEATSESGLAGQPAAEFWKDYAAMRWLWTIPGAAAKAKKLADGTWDVNLNDTAISDLKPLSGKRISRLSLGNTAVTDLTPLQGMDLTYLALYNTKVTDLSSLEGMPLEHLHISGTAVSDIAVVSRMPLTRIRLHSCTGLTDLSPLADAKKLTSLTLPPNAKNIEFLRDFTKLERLSFVEDETSRLPDKTFKQFWKDHDAKKKP